jgi:hypothetical protein
MNGRVGKGLATGCLAFAVTIAALLAVDVSQSFASHVQCGEVITQDTKLDSDLLECPGDGIVIGADSITLDLNGHTIDGRLGLSKSGIRNMGHDRVTIEDGNLLDFPAEAGVRLGNGADDNTVQDLTAADVNMAVYITRGSRNKVSGVTMLGLGYGLGIYIDPIEGPCLNNVIQRNLISNVFYGIANDDDDVVSGTRIEDNTIAGASRGILAFGEGSVEIVGNFVSSAGEEPSEPTVGIFSQGRHAVINRNYVSGGRAFEGINVSDDRGEGVQGTVSGNRVVNANVGIAIHAAGVTVSKNRVSDALFDGLRLEPGNTQTPNDLTLTVTHNIIEGSGGDGLVVHHFISYENVRVTLAKNTANYNGDLGIEGEPNTIDGGGNKAKGNGNPLQCVNVFCK